MTAIKEIGGKAPATAEMHDERHEDHATGKSGSGKNDPKSAAAARKEIERSREPRPCAHMDTITPILHQMHLAAQRRQKIGAIYRAQVSFV